MKEKEFCLLEEPWIRVLRQDCTVEEVSLVDALVRAHTFRALAGELPTQDAAMLRMLLAVLYAVFARTREAGGAEPLADADDALQRWQTLWEGGRFPEQPIRAYHAQNRPIRLNRCFAAVLLMRRRSFLAQHSEKTCKHVLF